MGLQDGHPEKDGVMVNLKDLVTEIQSRLHKKAEGDAVSSMTASTNGLSVAEAEKVPKTGDDGV